MASRDRYASVCRSVAACYCQEILQPPVLILEHLQPSRLGHLEAALARLPLVERGVADPALAAHLRRRHPASCARRIATVFSSLNLLLRIVRPLGDGLSFHMRDPHGSRSPRARLTSTPAEVRAAQLRSAEAA